MTIALLAPPAGSDTLPSIPGKEARHVWNGGTAVLNDVLGGYPRFYVITMGGLRSTADATLPAEQNTARQGEKPRFGQRSGKTLTFEGRVEALNLRDLRYASDVLEAAFWDPSQEYGMEIQTYVAGAWTTVYTYMARAVSIDGPEQQVVGPERPTGGYERPFVLTMRMADPRFYHVDEITASTGPITPGVYGAVPPFEPPVFLTPPAQAASVDLINPGTADALPVLTIDGPVSDPTVYNDTIGFNLSFQGVAIPQGSWLDVNFKTREVLLEGTSDYRRFQSGDWWDRGVPGLVPGVNTIRLAGTTMADPAKVGISFNPPRY